MQVIAWPFNGRPGKVNVMRSSPKPATWIRAQVTFRKVDNFFVVLFRSVAPKSENMYLAIDDVSFSQSGLLNSVTSILEHSVAELTEVF